MKIPTTHSARQIARGKIIEYLGGVGFANFYHRQLKPLPDKETDAERTARQEKERLFIPAAVLEDDLMEEFGVDIWRIVLPQGMLRKVKREHKEVEASDYLMLQRIVDGDLVYHDFTEGRRGTHLRGIAQDDNGKWWFAAWKKTGDGRELFFTTLFSIRERDLRRHLNRLGEPIKRGKK